MDSDNNYFCTAEIPGRFRRVALVPRPGSGPTSPVLEAQSLNHWPAREVPGFLSLKHKTVL